MCRSWGDTAHQPESTKPAPPLHPFSTVCARGREKFEQGTNHYSAIVVYSPCQREGCLVIYTAVSHAWALLEKKQTKTNCIISWSAVLHVTLKT